MILPTFEWVDTDGRFRLAIMPRPNPEQLDAHIEQMKSQGVDVLVSMLQSSEAASLGLAEEGAHCAAAGIEFLNHPVPDHCTPPDREAAETFARSLLEKLEAGNGVVIHCYAGIGRSATMAAAVMIYAGFSLAEATQRISAARRLRTPETPDQVAWLEAIEV